MINIKEEFKKKTVKQFKCTNCGGELTVMNKRTTFVGCNFCGAVIETTSDTYRVINQLQPPNNFPPKSFLTLGMIGKFDGKNHMIIGRTRWQSDYQEYYSEDGDTGYENESWEYDEWVLISEDAQYFYLIEDEEGYAISRSYTPKFPNLNQKYSIKNFDTGSKEHILEYGSSNVAYFEGESTYQIKPGDTVKFGMYKIKGNPFICESRIYSTGEIKEIEFFTERSVSYAEIVRAFADDDSVKSRQEDMQKRVGEIDDIKKRKLFYAKFFFYTSLAFLVGLFFCLGKSGKYLVDQTFPCGATCGDFVKKDSVINDTARTFFIYETIKPFTASTKDHILTVKLTTSFASEGESNAILEILNDKKEMMHELVGDFHRYIEEGSEDDYVDSKEDVSDDFQIDKDAEYHMRLTMDLPNAQQNELQVRLIVEGGSLMGAYFLFLWILFTIIALIFFVVYKKTK